jgi:cobalt-zinc-cadmium resistance protein CzcA
VLTQIGSPDDGTDPNPYSLIEVLVDLKSQESWRRQFTSKEDLVNALDKHINQRIPGLVCNFSQCIKDSMEEAMSGVKNGEYAVKIFGPDLEKLEKLGDQTANVLRSVPGIVDVSHDLLLGQPQLIVELEPEKAARLGVTAEEILDVVEIAVGGKSISKVVEGERRFDIVLRLKKEFRESPKRVGEILVSSPSGVKVPLKQLAKIDITNGANSIVRENNKRRIAVYGNIRGRDLGSAVLDSQKQIAERIKLPFGYTLSYAGEFERAREAGQRLLIIVPVTLLLIFGILYLAFDSAGLALLIMSAVPIASAVAVITLFVSETHLSVSSGVGLVALFGLSIQNAVIVAARYRDLIVAGAGTQDAISQAVVSKMNAVIIAALVAAVGLLPAAFSTGIGSQSQKPFATVIAFGILPSTLLTLLLLPALLKVLIKDASRPSFNETASESETAD